MSLADIAGAQSLPKSIGFSTQSLLKQPQMPWTQSSGTNPSDNATIPPTFSVGDLDNDMFLDFINHSAFDDPTPELVAGSPLKPG